MPRYRATNSFSGPIAVASKGTELDLTEEQADDLAGLVEPVDSSSSKKSS